MNNFIDYIKLEKEIYSKIFDVNCNIIEILIEKEINIDKLEKFLIKRDNFIEEIKKLEEKLSDVWNNWDKYSHVISKEEIQQLKEILLKNLEQEKKIVKLYENKINEIKLKLKEYERGKRALSGYKIAKINIPMFKSFKI